MKEARIIAPIVVNNLDPLPKLQTALRGAFGGYTIYTGVGAWTIPSSKQPLSEEVAIIDIAYEPSDENDAKLYDIARKFREDAKQVEVYLRYGNGHVQMVSEKSCMDNGHGHFDLEFGGMLKALDVLTDSGETAEDRLSALEYLTSSFGKKAL